MVFLVFEQRLLQAQNFENDGEVQKAWDIYIEVLSSIQFEEKFGEAYFKFALFLFRNQCYEESIQMFIKSYELQYEQGKILELIDEAYYTPNIEELRTIYDKNIRTLQSFCPDITFPSFESVVFKFIPISETSFYVFDQRNKYFIGIFSLGTFNYDVKAKANEIVVIRNEYDLDIINYYEKLTRNEFDKEHTNSPIYLIYDHLDEFFSYLQVIPFYKIAKNPRFKLFFTLIDFVNYFSEGEKEIPQSVVNEIPDDEYLHFIRYKNNMNSESNKEKVNLPKASLDYDSKSGCSIQNNDWDKGAGDIVLSFCILTYNRGQRALENVKHILQLSNKDIEVVVSDNCSPDEDGKYKELSLILDSRLKYYRNDENIGFSKNFLKVIERAQGKYAFILSDEDFVNLDTVPNLLDLLRKDRKVAVLKGSLQPKDKNAEPQPYSCCMLLEDAVFEKGYDALMNCGFSFNYISGAIYNRDLIIDNKLFKPVVENIDEHDSYPHLYLDALLCTAGTYRLLADVICLEGKQERTIEAGIATYQFALSFEGRLKQHTVFSKIINEVFEIMKYNDDVQKANLYLKCCNKTAFLIIKINGPFYIKEGRNLALLAENAYYYCLMLAGKMFKNIYLKSEIEKQVIKIFKDHCS